MTRPFQSFRPLIGAEVKSVTRPTAVSLKVLTRNRFPGVKTNFEVPRSYFGLPFTGETFKYNMIKLSGANRSLPRFEDDPFTAGPLTMCVGKLHRLHVTQCGALHVTPTCFAVLSHREIYLAPPKPVAND